MMTQWEKGEKTVLNNILFSSGNLCNAGKNPKHVLLARVVDTASPQLSVTNTVTSVIMLQVGCGFVWVQ